MRPLVTDTILVGAGPRNRVARGTATAWRTRRVSRCSPGSAAENGVATRVLHVTASRLHAGLWFPVLGRFRPTTGSRPSRMIDPSGWPSPPFSGCRKSHASPSNAQAAPRGAGTALSPLRRPDATGPPGQGQRHAGRGTRRDGRPWPCRTATPPYPGAGASVL